MGESPAKWRLEKDVLITKWASGESCLDRRIVRRSKLRAMRSTHSRLKTCLLSERAILKVKLHSLCELFFPLNRKSSGEQVKNRVKSRLCDVAPSPGGILHRNTTSTSFIQNVTFEVTVESKNTARFLTSTAAFRACNKPEPKFEL